MEFRRFIDSKDLEENEDLYGSIGELLTLIIFPEFQSLLTNDHDFYFDFINDLEPNNLSIHCRIHVFSLNIPADKDVSSTEFIEKYIAIKDKAMSNIIAKMSPTVKEDYLSRVSLSNDQFIIKLINIDLRPDVRAYADSGYDLGPENNQYGSLTAEVYITLILNIEDISGLEPNEIQALQAKYNYLCSEYSRQAITELQEWAKQLGLPIYNTKQELCLAIKSYYGF
jgi:hypothetical protein